MESWEHYSRTRATPLSNVRALELLLPFSISLVAAAAYGQAGSHKGEWEGEGEALRCRALSGALIGLRS